MIQIVVAVVLILVILLQQGKGSDMGAAFGGASSTVFGGASGRQSFLVKVTVVLATLFMLGSLGLSWRASYIQKQGNIPTVPVKEQAAPVVPGAAAPAGNFPAQTGTDAGLPAPDAKAPTPVAPSAPATPTPIAPSAPADDQGKKAPGKK
jgi:preprotein translocase subunit SecG